MKKFLLGLLVSLVMVCSSMAAPGQQYAPVSMKMELKAKPATNTTVTPTPATSTNVTPIVIPSNDIPHQTNTGGLYLAGEQTFEITPNFSSTNFFNHKAAHTSGISLEYEYWQSASMGTGLEFGNYNVSKSFSGVDHVALMEDYRIIPFPDDPFWRGLALVGKIGAETDLMSGSKGAEYGLGINCTLFKNRLRLEGDVMQHSRTQSNLDGLTVRFGLQFLF